MSFKKKKIVWAGKIETFAQFGDLNSFYCCHFSKHNFNTVNFKFWPAHQSQIPRVVRACTYLLEKNNLAFFSQLLA